MIVGMDVRRHDLIEVIAEVLMGARYSPPRRRRAAWHEGYDEDFEYARRLAETIVGVVRASGYAISKNPTPSPHHTP
jgi:hypothetical protein